MALPQTLARAPIIKKLRAGGKLRSRKNKAWRADILSTSLCGDVLQRLSPFIRGNAPVDIIDLWPGAGVWSWKVNTFLRPRRHLLLEPDTKEFSDFLEPLAKSDVSYEYLKVNPWLDNIPDLVSKYLPERQIQSNGDHSDALQENGTLLVLVNPPLTTSKKEHFLPARWWSKFIEDCMNLSNFNSYGRLQALASFPRKEARAVIPRSISERKRPAILTEAAASHAFEIAATHDTGMWSLNVGWDLTADNFAHVAKKTVENNIIIPRGRGPIPLQTAPKTDREFRVTRPYAPRVATELNKFWMADIEAGEAPHADDETKRQGKTSLYQLNYENRSTYDAYQRAESVKSIDQLVRRLSIDAANPSLDFKALKPVADKIEELKTAIANEPLTSEMRLRIVPNYIDSNRCARYSGSFDKALLAWDRRPFEPLLINHKEFFPNDKGEELTMFYFETDINSPLIKELKEHDPLKRDELLRIFDAFCFSIGTRGFATAGELLSSIFPDRSTNDLVRAVPSLAKFASKSLKPDFDSLPKTLHADPRRPKSDEPLDPVECFQENLDYDLSDTRVRVLPAITLWDLALEYEKSPTKLDSVELNRAMGSSLTAFRTGQFIDKK